MIGSLSSFGSFSFVILLDAVLKHLYVVVIVEQIVESAHMFFLSLATRLLALLAFLDVKVFTRFKRLFGFFEHPNDALMNVLVRLWVGVGWVVEDLVNFVFGRLIEVILGKNRSIHDFLDLLVQFPYAVLATLFLLRVS